MDRAPQEDTHEREATEADSERLVAAEVVADHAELSPAATRQPPADQARRAGSVAGAGHRKLASVLIANRLLILITFTALVIVGVVVSLSTGSWWAVVAAAGVHALGTLIVGSAK